MNRGIWMPLTIERRMKIGFCVPYVFLDNLYQNLYFPFNVNNIVSLIFKLRGWLQILLGTTQI